MQGTNSVLQNNIVENVAGSLDIGGPRPWIDVTAYGAKGDSVTNDTAAIQNAINAACAYTINGQNIHPVVFFPPGYYIVAQPQNPSTSPIFEIPCNFLTLQGSGTSGPIQFTRNPSTIIQSAPGSSPNNAPVFDVRPPNAGVGITFKDLNVSGYNKALWVYTSIEVRLDNVELAVSNTSLADNSALMLTNTLWFDWIGGECSEPEAANKYCILMTGDVPLSGEAPLSSLSYFDNIQGIGGMVRYDQRVNTSASGPGNWSFRNIRAWEGNQGPFLYISNSTGNAASAALPVVNSIILDDVTASDSSGQFPLIEVNSSGTNLQNVIIDMSLAGIGGSSAIQLDGGTASSILGCNIRGAAGSGFTAWAVVDASGNPMSGCSISNRQGFDFIASIQFNNGDERQRSDIFAEGDSNGPIIRGTFSGNRFAGVALDPVYGLMLNNGTSFGFGGSINQTVIGDIDVNFPTTYPPTALTGSATTGGAIANGTYYGTVYSSTSASNCTSTESAPSIQSSAVVLSGSNNAINWSWTLPVAGAGSVLGYCVGVSTTPNLNSTQWLPSLSNFQYIAGAGTTTLTMTALPTAGGPNTLVSTLLPVHRFTPTALGVGTTSPQTYGFTSAYGLACAFNSFSTSQTLSSANCKVNATATLTLTIPHANTYSWWIIEDTGGTTTIQADSGNVNNTTNVQLASNTGALVYCDGTNCWAVISGGGGSSPAGNTFDIQTKNGAVFGNIATPTTVAGVPWVPVEVTAGGAATAIAFVLPGLHPRNATTTDTIAATDCNPGRVAYTGTANIAVTLPTATTLGVPNCSLILANATTGSATTVTVTPTTWTLSVTGVGTSLASYAIPKNTVCRLNVDAAGSIWDVDCFQNSNANLTQTIANGATALSTSSVGAAPTCVTTTATATGTLSTDTIDWNPNASIKGVTGYVPSTSGGLSITAYPTSGNVNFDVCNWTSSSIIPGAVTINWSVRRP
jgi:hypothetical protein